MLLGSEQKLDRVGHIHAAVNEIQRVEDREALQEIGVYPEVVQCQISQGRQGMQHDIAGQDGEEVEVSKAKGKADAVAEYTRGHRQLHKVRHHFLVT